VTFSRLGAVDDIPLGKAQAFEVDEDLTIAVFHTDDGFFALDDVCSHAQASLSEGVFADGIVICPRHGGRFDLATGKARGLPATAPVRAFPVKVEGDGVFVDPDV